MKLRSILLTTLATFFCTASMSATNLYHTWVSASGSDSNPCTFTLPCASFNGALANTWSYGVISVKDTGDFGPVTIAQSVTIDGNSLGIITSTSETPAVTINSSGLTVVIRNLTLNNPTMSGFGISINSSGSSVTVDHCLLDNFMFCGIISNSVAYLTIENSQILGFGAHGIEIASGGQNVVVKNTVLVGVLTKPQYGFLVDSVSGTVQASLQGVTIQGPETAAVQVSTGTTEISNSVITQSATAVLANSGATVSVESSMLSQNTTAVCANTGGKIRLEDNDIFDNGTGVANCGGQVKTNSNNRDSGNTSGDPIPAADVSSTVLF